MRRFQPGVTFAHAAEVALAVLLFLLPLSLGSAPGWVLVPLVLLSLVASGSVLLSARDRGRHVAWPFWMWVPLAVAALCAVQLLPLPGKLLAIASPSAAELREYVFQAFPSAPWARISLDPPSTWRELAKHSSYALVLLSAASLARSKTRRRRLLVALVASGAVVAVLGLGHLLLGVDSLMGVYRFAASSPIVTPFGNPNHLAGYLGLCASVCLGLALSAGTRSEMANWAVLYAVLGAGLFLSLSVGGIVFFLGGQAALLIFGVVARWGQKGKTASAPVRRRTLVALLAVAGLATVGGLAAYERVTDELSRNASVEDLQRSKIQTWPMFAKAAWKFSGTGMGRGAFEPAFTRYQTLYPELTFTHPENLVLQLWAELGLVSAAFVLGLMAWGLYRAVRRSSLSALDASLLCGALGLVLQNLFDFSLELPAAAVALVVVLGIFARPETPEESLASGELDSRPVRTWRGAAFLLAPGALASCVALFAGNPTLRHAQAEVLALYERGVPAAQVEAAAAPYLVDHPADAFLYSLAGRAHASRNDGSVLRALMFINRALYLRPLDAEAHRTAARTLARTTARQQAFLEYRLAYEAGISRHKILDEAVPRAATVPELFALAPTNPEILTDVCRRLFALGRGQDAEALAQYGIDNILEAPVGLLHLERARQLAPKNLDSAWKQLELAEQQALEHPELPLLKAHLLRVRGQPEEAVKVLEAATVHSPTHIPLWIHLAEHLMLAGRGRLALEALKRAQPFAETSVQRSDLLWWEGNVHRNGRRYANALEAFRSASRLNPQRASFQYSVGEMYLELGRLDEAREALRRGRELDAPQSPQAVSLETRISQRAQGLAEQLERLRSEGRQP